MTSLPPTSAAGRPLRDGVAGAANGVSAVVAHVEAGGPPPGPAPSGRERGPVRILAPVGAGRVAPHLPMPPAPARPHDHGARPVDSGALTAAARGQATLVVDAVLAGAERAVFAMSTALPCEVTSAPVSGPLRTAAPTWVPKAEVARCGEPTRRDPPVLR